MLLYISVNIHGALSYIVNTPYKSLVLGLITSMSDYFCFAWLGKGPSAKKR